MGGGVCAAFDAQALCKIAGLVGWQSRWRPPGAARRGKQPLSSAVVAAADAPTTCACRARRLSSSSPSSSSPTVVVRRRRRRQRHLQPEIRSDPFPSSSLPALSRSRGQPPRSSGPRNWPIFVDRSSRADRGPPCEDREHLFFLSLFISFLSFYRSCLLYAE